MSGARRNREAQRIELLLARLPGWQFDEWRSVFIARTRRSLGKTTVPLGNGLALTLAPAVEARVEIGLRAGAREWTDARLQGLYAVDRWLQQNRREGRDAARRKAEVPGAKPKLPSRPRRKKPRRGEP